MPAPLHGALEVAPGLWRWIAYHVEWREEVGCVAIEAPEGLVVVDPLLPGEAGVGPWWRSLDRAVRERGDPIVVLTVHWHERSACEVVARYSGATLWADPSGAEALACAISRPIVGGERLPGGLEAIGTDRAAEIVLWHPATGTLIPGDVILGGRTGGLTLCPASWLPQGVELEELARTLEPLLDLPVERVLVSHREPVVDRAMEHLRTAIERAAGGADQPYRD
jgi:glyoxylase-like metal-dependent hydrolase (beta-lactamase superfamily II)